MKSTKGLEEGEAWVEEVVGHKRKGKWMQFRVKWVEDPKPTWEPFENMYVTIDMLLIRPLRLCRQSADAHIDDYVEQSQNASLIKWLIDVGYPVKVETPKLRQVSRTYSERRKRSASDVSPHSRRATAEKRQKPRHPSSPQRATSPGPEWKSDISEIMQVLKDDDGGLQVLLRFKDGTAGKVSNKTAKQVCPGALFKYYEDHL